MSKGTSTRVNPIVPPQQIFRTPQHPRSIEGPALRVMVDQLSGLGTSLASLGLNHNTQTSSSFSLPGS